MAKKLTKEGGLVLIQKVSVDEERSNYVKQGKSYPFFLIPERY